MKLNGRDCGDREEMISFLRRGPRGVLRPLEGIYGRFPSVNPVAFRARVPYLGKGYIEEKPLEPKLR